MTEIGANAVTRELRARLWPAVRTLGFTRHAGRSAWRDWEDGTDVIDVQSVGTQADAVGCTTFSFSARVATIPEYLVTPDYQPGSPPWRRGTGRPHYWNSPLQVGLKKQLWQPWFTPFRQPPPATTPKAFLVHRAALKRVLRRDRHDRPDIWFVREDGSNLTETVDDLRQVIETVAIPLLERLHDPGVAALLVRTGQVDLNPDSPRARDVIARALGACEGG